MQQRLKNSEVALPHPKPADVPQRMSFERAHRLPENQPKVNSAGVRLASVFYQVIHVLL
jgi:hypothetical protein